MPYTIYHADGLQVTVPDNAISASFYSGIMPSSGGAGVGIGLVGQNAVSYGAITAQNFLQITENFANTTAPTNAITGQTWFNTTTGLLEVYNGSWDHVGGVRRFNTRTGDITLLDTDVISALGYTPGSGGGTVSSVDASGGTTGLSFTGGPITTSGTLTLGGVLGVSNGGTGQTTQGGAANAVLPSQSSHSGQFLTTDGTNASWAAVSGGGGGVVTAISALGTQGVTASVTGTAAIPVINIGLGSITPISVTTSGDVVSGELGVAGSAQLHPGGSLNSGEIAFYSPAGVRQGRIGLASIAAGVDLGTIPYVAGTHQFVGDITATGNITASASDRRLKTNLTRIGEAVAKVQQLTGYTYNWDQQVCKEAGFIYSTERQVGVVAQDVQSVLPEAVAPAPANHDYLTVRYEKLVALLIEAVKEQAEEIAAIKELLK